MPEATGYLYYITTPFVSKEQLSNAELRRISRELNTQNQVLVLEGVDVVHAAQEEVQVPYPIHPHNPDGDGECQFCYGLHADGVYIERPSE